MTKPNGERPKDCLNCYGYCCIRDEFTTTPVNPEDVTRIAHHLQIPEDKFRRTHVTHTGRQNYYVMVLHSIGPCPFHTTGLCGINKVKPTICRNTQPRTFDGLSCRAWNKLRALGVP